MELSDYLRILRAHWVGIVVLTLVGTAAAFGWTMLQPRVYTADASGYVRAAGEGANGALVGENLARSKVTSYLDIGGWRAVAEHAIDDLGLDTTPEALVTKVRVSNPTDTVVIKVEASAGSPEEARDLAEAWIRGMLVEIEEIEGGPGAATVSLVLGDSARLPSAPSSPNVRLAVLLGALIGLALGLAYAVVRSVLDRRIRSAEAVERETGLPVVGTVPDLRLPSGASPLLPVDGADARGTRDELYPVSEAMRELRTNLQFMDVDNPPRIIVVTSPLPGDGKSTTSANLAITVAASGQPVTLVDADLRRPTLARLFGLVEGAGLTDVLAGRAEFADVAQPVGSAGALTVLGSGMIPPNPSEVLGSERMRDLLRTLALDSVVIVDAPPLIPVTDAAVLSARADGTFIVANTGRTTFEMLRKALQNLERTSARALGVVLNRVPRRGMGAAYYGYQYRGDYVRSGREARGGGDGGARESVPAGAADAGQAPRRTRRSGR